MTHSEKRTTVLRDYLLATVGGVLYGGTNTLVGHPLDTIKTKMQAQSGHMGQVTLSESIKQVWRNDGPLGFYKGWMPNFTGSVIFRSI